MFLNQLRQNIMAYISESQNTGEHSKKFDLCDNGNNR